MGLVSFFFLLPCFVEISKLLLNSVYPDQISRFAASDPGLHCLPMSLLWDTRCKWVNVKNRNGIGGMTGCRYVVCIGSFRCTIIWVFRVISSKSHKWKRSD